MCQTLAATQRRLAIGGGARQSPAAVTEEPIRVGDRVVHLQVPGVFVVVARRGAFVEVENDRGLRMTLHEVALRRVNGVPPEPKP